MYVCTSLTIYRRIIKKSIILTGKSLHLLRRGSNREQYSEEIIETA